MIFQVESEGERLDAFLARTADGMSRSAAQKLIETGNVLVNGKKARKNDRLRAGDRRERWEKCQKFVIMSTISAPMRF